MKKGGVVVVRTFAGPTVADGFGLIPKISLPTVVTISPLCVVPTVETHPAVFSPGQFVQLHIEATLPGVEMALTR